MAWVPLKGYPRIIQSQIIILTYPWLYKSGHLIPTYPWICKSGHLIPNYRGLSQSTFPIPGYLGLNLSWLAQGVAFPDVGDRLKRKVEAVDVADSTLRDPCSEVRLDVGGMCGRCCDSGSRCVDWQKQREWSVDQLQQASGRWRALSRLDVPGAKNPRNLPTMYKSVFALPGLWWLESRRISNEGYQSAISKQGWKCLANGMYCGKNPTLRIVPQIEPRSYGSVGDQGPSSARDEQRWASVSEPQEENLKKSLCSTKLLPALMCCSAEDNYNHSYFGNVCCLLLVHAD